MGIMKLLLLITLALAAHTARGATMPSTALSRCKPENLARLPFRIQKICLSLFKQIQGYEEDLEREMTSGSSWPVGDLYEAEEKRNQEEPGHVFLRLAEGKKGLEKSVNSQNPQNLRFKFLSKLLS